ncbi:MAG: hypothetical protein HZB42_15305 [Sphingobacteriales bacterium]|nr:hypothetical protein [Sphingobacteriales bacterium]
MKKIITSLCVIFFFVSCKKNNGDDTALLETPYPHQWIFTADASADKYVHLELIGNNMKRSEILKSYSLSQLTLERFCEFNVAESRTEFTNELCYTIQFERQRKRWLFAGNSSNGQEVHLSTTLGGSETADPGGDGYKFFIHEMPKVDGVRTVAIESVEKPGYYISTSPPGFNYSPTQVTLTQHSNPQSATHWQCRSSK